MPLCEIVAEIGLLHDGSIQKALQLIKAAAKCGADVIKFQTHIPEAETLFNAPPPKYFNKEPRFQYFRRTGFSEDQWKKLKEMCEENYTEFLSSVFSIEAVD